MDDAGTTAPLLGEPLPVELMNTIWADREGVHDALADPAQALGWLRAVGDRLAPQQPEALDVLRTASPTDPAVDDTAADELRTLRDALRRLAAEATSDPRPAARSATPDRAAALRVLDRACALAPTRPGLHWPDGGVPHAVRHSTAPPAHVLVTALAEQAVDLFGGDRVHELRACPAPGCVLYFLRHHPRREWCSAGCGNRARVARHYRRHHPRAADAG